MRKRLLILFQLLILTIFYTGVTWAGISPECSDLLSSHRDVRFKEVLQAQDKSLIQDVLSSELTTNQKWKQASEIYLEARLRLLPEDFRQPLRRQLMQFQPHFVPYNEEIVDSKRFIISHRFQQTALPYILLVHEWEHQIRSFFLGEGLRGINYKFNAVAMYREELFSLSAEWELAQFVSDEEAYHLIEISKSANISPRFVDMVSTMMNSRKLSKSDYVKAIHQSGRYSVLDTLRKTAKSAAITGAVLAWPASLCWFLASLFL